MDFRRHVLILLVVILVGFLEQQIQAQDVNYYYLSTDEEVKQETLKKFNELQTNVRSLISSASDTLLNQLTDIQHNVDSVNEDGRSDSLANQAKVINSYVELLKNYENDSEQLEGCASPLESGLENLAMQIIPLISSCTILKFGTVSTIVNDALDQLGRLSEPLNAIEASIAQCMLLTAKQSCLYGIQDTISILDSDITSSGESIVNEQNDIHSSFSDSISKCSSDRVEIITTVGNQILDQITTCMEPPITDPSPTDF